MDAFLAELPTDAPFPVAVLAAIAMQQQPAVCPAMFSGGGSSKPKKAVGKAVGKPAAKASSPLSGLFGSKAPTAKKPLVKKVVKKAAPKAKKSFLALPKAK